MNERFFDTSDQDLRAYSEKLRQRRQDALEFLLGIIAEQRIVTAELLMRDYDGQSQAN